MKVIDGVQSAPAGVRVFVHGMPERAQVEYVVLDRTESLIIASISEDKEAIRERVSIREDLRHCTEGWR